jgi:dolichol-phosphate mannosyltransferase
VDFYGIIFLCQVLYIAQIDRGVKPHMKLTIIIPAHNEEESLPKTLYGLQIGVKVPNEVIVVDDHSSDGTFNIVMKFINKYNNIRVIKNNTSPGFTNAIKRGFSEVKDGAVVLVMADACDDPETINVMYEKIIGGYDIVCGSRYMQGGSREGRPLQGFFSRLVGIALHMFIRIPTRDCSNAFKMYRKEVLDSINIEEAGFASSLEASVKAFSKGFKIAEVPTCWKKREAGESKFSITNVSKNYIYWFFWALFKNFNRRPS